LKRSLLFAGRRTWTLVLALAFLVSHGLGTVHSHASTSHDEASPARVQAVRSHQDSGAHLEQAPGDSGFCLACALLAQAGGTPPILKVQVQAHTVETSSSLPLLPHARPLNQDRPGRSPPAA